MRIVPEKIGGHRHHRSVEVMYTGLESQPAPVLSTIKKRPLTKLKFCKQAENSCKTQRRYLWRRETTEPAQR